MTTAQSTWDQFIKVGEDVKAKTGHQFIDLDFNNDELIRMMMQSVSQWYFNKDGSLDILDNQPLKAALTEHAKIWQAGIVKSVSGWANYTGAFTSGDVAAVSVGVWITGTIAAARTTC